MKPNTILGFVAFSALTAVFFAYRKKNKREIYNRIYQHDKEDSIKAQKFKTKVETMPPKIIYETLDKFDNFRTATLQWLFNMLLYNKIALQDIPRDIRVSDNVTYIGAFRISSRKPTPCERFIKDMNTLCEDICSLDNDATIKGALVETFSRYLNSNEHKEDEIFVNFEKNLCEKILWEMRKHSAALQKNLDQQFKNCGIK